MGDLQVRVQLRPSVHESDTGFPITLHARQRNRELRGNDTTVLQKNDAKMV